MSGSKTLEVSDLTQEVEEGGIRARRFSSSYIRLLIAIVAVVMSIYHIYMLGFRLIIPLNLYATHWAFGMVLIFALYPGWKAAPKQMVHWFDWACIAFSVAICIYILWDSEALMLRAVTSSPTTWDLFFGAFAILLSLEAARRTTGPALPIIVLVLLFYAWAGGTMPGILGHRGYSLDRIVSYVFGTDGVFGVPLKASATQVFLLVLFGAFLHVSGVGEFFMNLATALTGGTRGGPAKISIIASTLFGTISGSAVANVVGTGNFTIPLMKRTGYQAHFAGAVEAAASTGGQIMPPIMGTAAFVMAELLGIPYSKIAIAALFPALLYYIALFIMVDLEAVRVGLKGLNKSELPNLGNVFKQGFHLILPFMTLIYVLIVMGQSVVKASLWAILVCVLVCTICQAPRVIIKNCFKALEMGALRSLSVVATCSAAGIAIGAILLTGAGMKITFLISRFGETNMLLSLVLAALMAVILGMGLPTVAAYIITASVLVSGLVSLHIQPLAAHMFLFYFSIMSMVTPPVALAAYAAGAISGANPHKIGFAAMKLGATAYIIPFMFVYNSSLLLIGTSVQILTAVISAVIGTSCLAISIHGVLFTGESLNIISRCFLFGSALLMIKVGIISDLIGLLCILIGLTFVTSFRKRFFGLFRGKTHE